MRDAIPNTTNDYLLDLNPEHFITAVFLAKKQTSFFCCCGGRGIFCKSGNTARFFQRSISMLDDLPNTTNDLPNTINDLCEV